MGARPAGAAALLLIGAHAADARFHERQFVFRDLALFETEGDGTLFPKIEHKPGLMVGFGVGRECVVNASDKQTRRTAFCRC